MLHAQDPPPTTINPGVEDVSLDGAEKGATARHAEHHIDPATERSLVRKLDWHLVPLVSSLYLMSFLDRGNIGNARTAGMSTDLNLVGNRYTWLLDIFYITYILGECGTLVWKVVPAHIWAAFLVFSWGLIATLQGATTNWQGMMACRFFMGFVEAGFGPGIPYVLSFFYLRRELGFRIGIYLAAAPLASTFAGALAYGITSGHAHIANWRLLFIVEGIPSILLAAVAFFYMPDSPETARFLSPEEKAVARARVLRQVGSNEKRVGGIVWKDVLATFADPKAYFTAFMYFSCNVGFSSLPVFLPTILTDMGFTAVNAQGLTAPPYFLSFLVTILSCYIADRTGQRGYTIMVLSSIGGIGYVLLCACSSVGVRYFGVFLAASGIFPSIANILSWVLNNQGSDTRRGVAIVILNLIGQCGPLLGTNVFPTIQAPRYIEGFAVSAAFTWFTALLALGLRCLLVWENKKLDRKYGTKEHVVAMQMGSEEDSAVAEENYGATFRYIL